MFPGSVKVILFPNFIGRDAPVIRQTLCLLQVISYLILLEHHSFHGVSHASQIDLITGAGLPREFLVLLLA